MYEKVWSLFLWKDFKLLELLNVFIWYYEEKKEYFYKILIVIVDID